MYITDETADVITIENILLTYNIPFRSQILVTLCGKVTLALSILLELLKINRVFNILANL